MVASSSLIFRMAPAAHPAPKSKDSFIGAVSPLALEHTNIYMGENVIKTHRWLPVVLLCGLVSIICSLDRTAMSIAILPLSKQFKWNDSVKGAVSSAFNVGHMITNLWGGYLASARSPKHVLMGGVFVWSLFTVLTPLACHSRSLTAILLVRALMGFGEGVAFPTMQAIVRGWVPLVNRSKSLGLMYSGHQFGSILAMLLSPFVINSLGVDSMFHVYGLLGFIWIFACHYTVSDQPPLAPATQHVVRFRDLPWRAILTNRAFWSILLSHAMFGVVYNIGIAWLPTFFSEQFGLDVRQSAFLSVAPWVAMAAGTLSAGCAADSLIQRKWLSTTQTRKLMQVIGAVGPGICLVYLAAFADGIPASSVAALQDAGGSYNNRGVVVGGPGMTSAISSNNVSTGSLMQGGVSSNASLGGGAQAAAGALDGAGNQNPISSPLHAAVLLSVTMGLLGFQAGGFASNHQDIAGTVAPVLFGLTNATSSLAGSVCVFLVGTLLQRTGSWALIFRLVAACCFGSASVYVVYGSSERHFT